VVDFFVHASGSILGLGFGAFLTWWGLYAIRNKKMMWFTRNSVRNGYFETKAKYIGYILVAYGALSIAVAVMTLFKK